jgi:hypothetical protein
VADELPAGMEIVVKLVPPGVAENSFVPLEFDAMVSVSAVVVGLPKLSCSWTMIDPRVALEVAVPEMALEAKTHLEGAAGVTVSDWVPDVSPEPATVIVGDPDFVSP